SFFPIININIMVQKPFTSLENILPASYSNEIEVNIYNLIYEISLPNKNNYNLTYKSLPSNNIDNYDLTYKSSPDKDTYSLTNKNLLNKSAFDLTNKSLDIENETIREPEDITKDNSTSTKECQKILECYAKQNNFVLKKKQKLTVKIKDLIESYMLCNFDVFSQIRLLCELFSEATISSNAAKLLQYLEKEHTKDPDSNVQLLIDPETNRL
ncbi:8563_t:CDS:2, partial [Scutellospora calospora]